MCVKAPKPTPKTAEEVALEQEAKSAREQRKKELSALATREKEKRFEETVARSRGQWGARSLISGPKGGAGFLFGGGRSGLPLISPSSPGSGGGGGGGYSGGGGSGYTGGFMTPPSLIGGAPIYLSQGGGEFNTGGGGRYNSSVQLV
jgi:hypothetical protein